MQNTHFSNSCVATAHCLFMFYRSLKTNNQLVARSLYFIENRSPVVLATMAIMVEKEPLVLSVMCTVIFRTCNRRLNPCSLFPVQTTASGNVFIFRSRRVCIYNGLNEGQKCNCFTYNLFIVRFRSGYERLLKSSARTRSQKEVMHRIRIH